jgi:N-terminal acetyltransferase B complex catalytic subunit
MVSIRPWSLDDIWHYSRVNIYEFTETNSIPFYLFYTMQWPQLGWTVRNNSDTIVGYLIGSANSKGHEESTAKGHVVAVTVCEDYRRLGIASHLMAHLEHAADQFLKAQFIDLYVRPTNTNAQEMYLKLGYVVYRRILNYYESLHEDGLDMRKSLPRDVEKKFMVPLPHPVTKDEVGDD